VKENRQIIQTAYIYHHEINIYTDKMKENRQIIQKAYQHIIMKLAYIQTKCEKTDRLYKQYIIME